MPRLFIAIALPGEVKRALGRLRCELPGARWAPQEQLHLTLAFLGEQDEALIERLKDGLAAIRLPRFRLRFTVPRCVPGPGHPRVLWIGLEDEPRLGRLAAGVRKAVLACGIPLEERSFTPHITLARFRPDAGGEVFRPILQGPRPSIASLEVRGFTLYQSRLSAAGAVHTPLAEFTLSGGD